MAYFPNVIAKNSHVHSDYLFSFLVSIDAPKYLDLISLFLAVQLSIYSLRFGS